MIIDSWTFCLQQGRRATIAFFKNYVYENKSKLKPRKGLSVIEEEPRGYKAKDTAFTSSSSDNMDLKMDDNLKIRRKHSEKTGEQLNTI